MTSAPNLRQPLNGNKNLRIFFMKSFFHFAALLLFLLTGVIQAQELPVAQRQTEILSENNETYIIHTVQKGETIYSIARAYETRANDILALNPDAPAILPLGYRLKVKDKTVTNANIAKPQPTTESFVYHIVKKGQNLKEIASIYGSSEAEILQVNKLDNRTIIADQVIKVPLDYSALSKNNEKSGESRDDGFITHIVSPQETLYGISKQYGVNIADIIEWNPFVSEGLKVGQLLRVKIKQEETINTEPVQHTVGRKETLYGISRKYRVSIDSLKMFNPGLSENLSEGQQIRIPSSTSSSYITHTANRGERTSQLAMNYQVTEDALRDANPGIGNKLKPDEKVKIPIEKRLPKEQHQSKSDQNESHHIAASENENPICPAEYKFLSKEFNVALMIPFALDEADTSAFRLRKASAMKELPFFRFIQFYEGCLLALDTLKQHGLKINFHVYDASRKTDKTQKMLNRPEMAKMDLIISIAYSRNFELISEFCQARNIPLVNAISKRPEITRNSPVVFKILPDEEGQTEAIAEYIASLSSKTNVIIVRGNKYQFGPVCDRLRESIPRLSDSKIRVTYLNDSISLIRNRIKPGYNNVLICVSDNQAWVMDLVRNLSARQDTGRLMIIGIPSWSEMNNLDSKGIMKLNVHFLKAEIPDEESLLTQWFIKRFHESYFSEPDELAHRGFDVTFYFMSALLRFGNDFNSCIENLNINATQTRYKFTRNSPHGYENRFWNIYRYDNYKTRIVNR